MAGCFTHNWFIDVVVMAQKSKRLDKLLLAELIGNMFLSPILSQDGNIFQLLWTFDQGFFFFPFYLCCLTPPAAAQL